MKKVLCFLICITFLRAAMAQYLPEPCTGPKQELVPFLKGKKWGFCNRDKKLVIPAVYDQAAAFGTVPPDAEKLHYPAPDAAYVRKGKQELWVNTKGETWPVTGGEVREKYSGQRIVKDLEKVWEANYTANGKLGFILEGDTVVPALYDEVSRMPNGDFYLKLRNKAGVQDSSKNWIVPMEFEDIVQIRLNNEHYQVYSRAYKVMKGGRWGLYAKGNPVMPVQYRSIGIMDVWSFDWYKVQNEDGSWCLMDGSGKGMSDTYDELGSYAGIVDRMAVKKQGRWGFVDSKGILQVACKYSEVQEFHYVNGLALVTAGKRSFYVDCMGVEYCSK